jgi:hypothetical protein
MNFPGVLLALASALVDGQVQDDFRIFSFNALEPEFAPMFLHDPVTDTQTQSGAFALWFGGEERVTNAI